MRTLDVLVRTRKLTHSRHVTNDCQCYVAPMNLRIVAACIGLIACTPALPPPDGTERKLLQSDQTRDDALRKAATGYTLEGQPTLTPMVDEGELIRVAGGKCYLVVIRFRTADLSSAAREHGIDVSINLNAPSLSGRTENGGIVESANPDYQGGKGGVVVGQGAYVDAGCVDRPVYLIPSFNVHYAIPPRDVSAANATVEVYSRAATTEETQLAGDVADYHRKRGVSVGIGHCEDCKSQFHACKDQGNPEPACRRSFYDCAGDDANTCSAPN